LPFRLSPATKHIRLFSQSPRSRPKPLFTQTLTPADSSEEETSPPYPHATNVPRPQQSFQLYSAAFQHLNESLDADMDMIEPQQVSSSAQGDQDTVMISPKASPRTLLSPGIASAGLGLQDASAGGRLPTPIYGHFQQSIDTKMDAETELTPPKSQQDVDYELYMRRRRLPSPISEDEAMDASESTQGPIDAQGGQGLRKPARFPPPLPNQGPKGGKIMFSMGFRADCEMCRNRVPGHCNHILRV